MDNRRKIPAKVGRRLFLGGTAAGLVVAPAIVSAQNDWPNRQIRVVIPYPPGGPSDVTTRLVLERAGAVLGQSILFDNKAGASGAIGAEHVIKSCAGRRLHLPDHDHGDGLHHRAPAAAALRYGEGPRGGGAHRDLVDGHGHQPAGARQQSPGVHRLRQGQSRQGQLRLGGPRHHHPALRRDLQHRGRREDGSCAVQGQRAGDQRPAVRPDPGAVRSDDPAAHRRRPPEVLRGAGREALAR